MASVAKRAEVKHRRREAERVTDGDQVEAGLACIEGLADVRQGDVGDRQVQVGDTCDEDQSDQDQACIPRSVRSLRGFGAGWGGELFIQRRASHHGDGAGGEIGI